MRDEPAGRILIVDDDRGHREAEGLGIVKRGVKREPIALVQVDLANHLVLGWETPPATVRWGNVPTPYF